MKNNVSQNTTTDSQYQKVKAQTNEYYFFNSLNITSKVNNKNLISLKALVSLDKVPEKLGITKLIGNLTIKEKQNITSEKSKLQLLTNYHLKIGDISNATLSAGSYLSNSTITSTLFNSSNTIAHSNDIKFHKVEPFALVNYQLENRKIYLNQSVKISQCHYKYDNYSFKRRESKNLINGSFSVKYKINKLHSLNGSYNLSETTPGVKRLISQLIMTSNRTYDKSEISFKTIITNTFRFNYSYYNLLKDVSVGFGYTQSDKNRSIEPALFIFQDSTVRITNCISRKTTNRQFSGKTNCFIAPINSRIIFNCNYNVGTYYNLLNSLDLRKNKSKVWSSGLKYETGNIGSFIFSNSTTYLKSTFKQDIVRITNETLINKLSIFFDKNRVSARLNYLYSIPSLSNKSNKNQNLNVLVELFNRSKTFCYKLEARNLINNKSLTSTTNTDYQTSITTQDIQDRYFILSINFRL